MCPDRPEFLFVVVHDFKVALQLKRKQLKVHRKVHNIETTWTCNGVACIFRNWTKPINWRSAYALKMKIPYERNNAEQRVYTIDAFSHFLPTQKEKIVFIWFVVLQMQQTNNARFLIYFEINHWSQYLNWNLMGFIGLIA